MTEPKTDGASDDDGEDSTRPARKRDVAKLAAIIVANQSPLFHTPAQEPYAIIEGVAHPTKSRAVRLAIQRAAYMVLGSPLSRFSLETAADLLACKAIYDGPEQDVYMRVAGTPATMWIDLGGNGYVKVADGTWILVPTCPLAFRRAGAQLALPTPHRGGNVGELRRFLNLPDGDEFRLLVAWMVAAFNPGTPCPIGVLVGEQGTAKSTATRMVRALTDPNSVPLRSIPTKEDDLAVSAQHSHVLAFDNVSGLSGDMLDAMCKLCTGGGIGKRSLYTDQDETAMNARRPILLNGISDFAERGDVAQRSVVWRLLPIITRQDEGSLWTSFAAAAPGIFGGLLDILASCLQRLPSVSIPDLPRMADFALLLGAVAPSLGVEPGDLVAAFNANQQAATDKLAADPLVRLLANVIRARGTTQPGSGARLWVAPPHEIHHRLQEAEGLAGPHVPHFPATPATLGKLIRRMAPQLRALGLVIDIEGHHGRGDDRGRAWTLGSQL